MQPLYLKIDEDVKVEPQLAAKRRKRSRWEPESSENDINVMPSYVHRGKLIFEWSDYFA